MDMVMGIGCVFAGILCIMLSVYIALCFISWAGEVIETKSWRFWK